MEEKSSGTVLGAVGLWYPNDWPGPEIKWALTRSYWGKGFASEAARAVKQMATEALPDMLLMSFIHSENAASIKMAIAIGGMFEKQVEFRGGFWHVYRY